jgi:hypothetical protein
MADTSYQHIRPLYDREIKTVLFIRARHFFLGTSTILVPKNCKNIPHNQFLTCTLGGNTWAGGTGGRDTAGLGGKGGPYRLDAGHAVHQLSQAEIDNVPEHVKKAARDTNFHLNYAF